MKSSSGGKGEAEPGPENCQGGVDLEPDFDWKMDGTNIERSGTNLKFRCSYGAKAITGGKTRFMEHLVPAISKRKHSTVCLNAPEDDIVCAAVTEHARELTAAAAKKSALQRAHALAVTVSRPSPSVTSKRPRPTPFLARLSDPRTPPRRWERQPANHLRL